jgi:hypothetical protein
MHIIASQIPVIQHPASWFFIRPLGDHYARHLRRWFVGGQTKEEHDSFTFISPLVRFSGICITV